jgi:hypothetical protein
MKNFNITERTLPLVILGAALVTFLIDKTLVADRNGTFLLNLIFWVAITQGCIALAAVSELSKAKWILPIRRELLAVYPMLLFVSILFVFFGLQLDIYPWAQEGGLWLNKKFFFARNLALLVASYILAKKFADDTLQQRPRKNLYAVLYLLAFVTTQSLVAFDWVMSLEYPWFSTLFGGYFFIESFYTGIALAGVAAFYLLSYTDGPEDPQAQKALKDVATLLFGFSLLWAGLFFSQFLVIWYGNLPEEVIFLVRRVVHSPLRELSYFVLLALFVLPFTILLSIKTKTNKRMVLGMSLLVLFGVLIERLVFLAPVTGLRPITFLAEFALAVALFALVFIKNREMLSPKG